MKRKTYNIFPVSLMVYSIIAMIAGYFFWEITHDSPENYSEFWRDFFAINTLLSLFVGPLGYLLYHKHSKYCDCGKKWTSGWNQYIDTDVTTKTTTTYTEKKVSETLEQTIQDNYLSYRKCVHCGRVHLFYSKDTNYKKSDSEY